jgi:HEAT repeat protein
MRSYALQHMMLWYGDAEASEKGQIREVLWEAIGKSESSIPGTALLALLHLSQDNAEFDPPRISEIALKLAQDERSAEITRITALQVCAQNHVDAIVPTALDIALHSGSIPLKMSAIAALGDVAGLEAKSLLDQMALGQDERLRLAAESALARWNKRNPHSIGIAAGG